MKPLVSLILVLFSTPVFAGKWHFNPFHKEKEKVSSLIQQFESDNHLEQVNQYFLDISEVFADEMNNINEDGADGEDGMQDNYFAVKPAALSSAHSFVNIHIGGLVSNFNVKYDQDLKKIFNRNPEKNAKLLGLYYFQGSAWQQMADQIRKPFLDSFGYWAKTVVLGEEEILRTLENIIKEKLENIDDLSSLRAVERSAKIALTVLEAVVQNPDITRQYFRKTFVKSYKVLSKCDRSAEQFNAVFEIISTFNDDPLGVQYTYKFLEKPVNLKK